MRLLFYSYQDPEINARTCIIKSLSVPSWCVFIFTALKLKSHLETLTSGISFQQSAVISKNKVYQVTMTLQVHKNVLFPFSFLFGGGGEGCIIVAQCDPPCWWKCI